MPEKLKIAASVAVCFGLASLGGPLPAEAGAGTPQEPLRPTYEERQAEAERRMRESALQRGIISWYASQLRWRRYAGEITGILENTSESAPDDPGVRYFLDFAEGRRGETIGGRLDAIRSAFGTAQPSLCLAALAWRDVTEWCLDGPPPGERIGYERAALAEALALIDETAERWRRDVSSSGMFVIPGGERFLRTKAGPPLSVMLAHGLRMRRGFNEDVRRAGELPDEFLEMHPFAGTLDLECSVVDGGGIRILRGGELMEAGEQFTLRAFDMLITADGEGVGPAVLEFARGRDVFTAHLPRGAGLAYGDVLRLVHCQNAEKFAQMPASRLRDIGPLAIPELRRRTEGWLEPAGERGEDAQYPQSELWALINLLLF